VIDGRIAFAGGINVIDDFDDGAGLAALRLRGAHRRPAGGAPASCHVRHVWRLVRWASSAAARRPGRCRACSRRRMEGCRPRFLVRDNLRHRHDIEYAYLEAIRGARGKS
jgi:cardiolipin synthase